MTTKISLSCKKTKKERFNCSLKLLKLMFVVDVDQSFGGNMDDSTKEFHTDRYQLRENTQAFLQDSVRRHR